MIIVYNKELNNFHELTHAISVQFEENYNNIGKAILTLPIDDYNISIIENGGIVYDTVRDMSFVIVNHKYDTTRNLITVNAYTCNWLLNKRTIAEKSAISNIESDVYEVVRNNLRGLKNIALADVKGYEDTADAVMFGGQLLDGIMPILETAQIGNRMRWDADNRQHVFELYKGNDLTEGIHAVVFSEEYKTAKNLTITNDDSVLKNYIYVTGILQDDSEIIVEVGTSEGDERHERWISSSSRQENNETESQFRKRLQQIGMEEAAKLVSRKTFSVTIDTAEYGVHYKLGDVISCVSQRFGVELKSRITSVQYKLDINGEKINLILGEPILTALGEVKLLG